MPGVPPPILTTPAPVRPASGGTTAAPLSATPLVGATAAPISAATLAPGATRAPTLPPGATLSPRRPPLPACCPCGTSTLGPITWILESASEPMVAPPGLLPPSPASPCANWTAEANSFATACGATSSESKVSCTGNCRTECHPLLQYHHQNCSTTDSRP